MATTERLCGSDGRLTGVGEMKVTKDEEDKICPERVTDGRPTVLSRQTDVRIDVLWYERFLSYCSWFPLLCLGCHYLWNRVLGLTIPGQ